MFVNRKNRVKFFLGFTILLLISGISIFSYNTCAGNKEEVGVKNDYSVEKRLLIENEEVKNSLNDINLQRKIKLLDINKKLVAEYIEFENTLHEYMGYVIRDVKSGHIYDYSNEGNLFEKLLKKSELTYEDVCKETVYFVNPFEIYVESNNGQIIDLMPKSGNYSSTITKNELEEAFSKRQVKFGRPPEPELKKLKPTKLKFNIKSYFTPCVMDDFDNLKITDSKGRKVYPHDHCSPTAATTIMKYFKYLGKSSLSDSYSNNDVFAKFYIAMDTNGGVSGNKDSGTTRSEIAPSYIKVGKDLSVKPKDSSTLGDTSSKTMQSALERGMLLHVSVDNFDSVKGGHSIAVISYYNGYFKIADGWNSYFRNVSYSDINVEQVVAVSY